MRKKFYFLGQSDSFLNSHEEFEQYMQVWDYVKGLSDSCKDLKTLTLLSILNIGSKIGKYDETILHEYLKIPRFNHIYKTDARTHNQYQNNSLFKDLFPFNDFKPEYDLIEDHLTHFFLQDQSSTTPYEEYFNPGIVQKIYTKARILSGRFYIGTSPQDFSDGISQSEINQLVDRIELSEMFLLYN